jgi:hypothetical protein
MKKKLIGILVLTLLIATVIPVKGFNIVEPSIPKLTKGHNIIDVGEIRIYNDSLYGYQTLVTCNQLPQINCNRSEEICFKCTYFLDATYCTCAKAEIFIFEEDEQEPVDYAKKEIFLGQNISNNISVITTYNPSIGDSSTYCRIKLKGSFEKDGIVHEDECESFTELSKSSIKYCNKYLYFGIMEHVDPDKYNFDFEISLYAIIIGKGEIIKLNIGEIIRLHNPMLGIAINKFHIGVISDWTIIG